MAGKDVSIAYADGTGSFLVLLAMAEQQGLFGKYGVDVRSVAVKGATVPRLTTNMPLGMIRRASRFVASGRRSIFAPCRFFQRHQAFGPSRCTTRYQELQEICAASALERA